MKAKAKSAVGRFTHAKVANASMAICALVAAADGTIDSSERTKTANAIAKCEELKDFDMKVLKAKFEEYATEMDDPDFGTVNLEKVIRQVKGDEDDCRMVLALGIIIGKADGNFDDKEKAICTRVAKMLGLNPLEFDLPV
ncbi:tellurite resistance TerB family protein [Acinetobacter sp.]|uniref:tellurite resistance TerB family protein n=1 Tax=Acinetobacter sp. TaxID=472 RepID=UPI0037503B34